MIAERLPPSIAAVLIESKLALIAKVAGPVVFGSI